MGSCVFPFFLIFLDWPKRQNMHLLQFFRLTVNERTCIFCNFYRGCSLLTLLLYSIHCVAVSRFRICRLSRPTPTQIWFDRFSPKSNVAQDSPDRKLKTTRTIETRDGGSSTLSQRSRSFVAQPGPPQLSLCSPPLPRLISKKQTFTEIFLCKILPHRNSTWRIDGKQENGPRWLARRKCDNWKGCSLYLCQKKFSRFFKKGQRTTGEIRHKRVSEFTRKYVASVKRNILFSLLYNIAVHKINRFENLQRPIRIIRQNSIVPKHLTMQLCQLFNLNFKCPQCWKASTM